MEIAVGSTPDSISLVFFTLLRRGSKGGASASSDSHDNAGLIVDFLNGFGDVGFFQPQTERVVRHFVADQQSRQGIAGIVTVVFLRSGIDQPVAVDQTSRRRSATVR